MRGDCRELDDAALAALDERFTRLLFPDHPLWTGRGAVLRWYADDDALLRCDAGAWLWVLARDAAHLGGVRADLPGDWQDIGGN